MRQIADKIAFLMYIILLNVRQPYDARTLVLRSRAGLSPDVLAELQVRSSDSRACFIGRCTVRRILAAAVE